ncbi:MAG: HAD family hydrolase [Firmicutes bacterium HGW-Firmicutes-15]|nr:MAG: HAD family hydrolase [Firmicutes bacterium HGW-Firmicutes-15]
MLADGIKRYKHVIWDWNGTLLDDVNIVIEAMNNLLKRRELPLLDIEMYKDIFTFPVIDYYAKLGFDFDLEPFEKLAIEFLSEFNSDKYQFSLHIGVEEVLHFIKSIGISQSILSASQEQELTDSVRKLNINEYFLRVVGLNNHYAMSKIIRGKDLLDNLGLEPNDVLLIGDTIHDYEVSKEIGCDCLLICNGHQSYQRISNCHTRIVKTISNVVGFLKGEVIL